MKGILNFTEKVCWTLVLHSLSTINKENILSLDRVTLVAGIIEGYEINVARIISLEEIHDRAIRTDTTLEFPFLLTQLCLNREVPEIPGVDQFLHTED